MRILIFIFILFFVNSLFAGIHVDTISGESLSTTREEIIDLSRITKPLVLIFISKDCPCSKGNLSYIDSLSRDYPDFKFLGIHSKKGTTLKEVKEYLNDKKIHFEVLNDSNLTMANKLSALKTPHAYILNDQGEVVYNGGVTSSTFPQNAKEFFLKNALDDLRNHRPVAKNETRTLGCVIAR